MGSLFLCLVLLVQSDPWWAKDKVRHFATAYVLTKSSMQAGIDRRYSAAIVFTLSVGKEVYDKKVKKTFFSFKDIIYDLAGVTLGLLL